MAKLADVTSEVRIILKLLAASFLVAFAIFLFFKGGVIIKTVFFPTPKAPPAQKFGILPRVNFPPQTPTNFSYQINTLTGKLPEDFPDRINVYKVKMKNPSLSTLVTVRASLATVNFSGNETKLSDSIYQWSNQDNDTIQYNILTDNFKLNTDFLTQPPASLPTNVADKDGAFKQLSDFLSNIAEDTSDIDQNKSTATYLKIQNNALVAADSQNDGEFIQLDLFQKDLDGHPIYYPGLNGSNMKIIYGAANGLAKIVSANYNHYIADQSQVSDYPIKTAEQAYEDLKKGNALIFNNNPPSSDPIQITDVSLGYYSGQQDQSYLVPVVIFSSKNFVAFVQALPDSSIGN